MVFSYWFVSSYKNIKKIFTFWHTYLLFILKSACYSVTKYYLCRQNNKRSLLGRKQRIQVARSFPNHYLFSCTNKVTSLFSISCISRIILQRKRYYLLPFSFEERLEVRLFLACCEAFTKVCSYAFCLKGILLWKRR